MDRQFAVENRRESERIKSLAKGTTEKHLNLVLNTDGWTIAAILAHLAVGDRKTLELLKEWRKNGVTSEPLADIDPTNDELLPFFLSMEAKGITKLTISLAERLDRELEEANADLIEAIEILAPHRLHRSKHRKLHLDEIEEFLETKRREES